jgi:hypothetical protein
VSLLSQDALTPAARGGTGQAVALHLLAAIVAADGDAGGGAVAAEVHSKGLGRALLDGVARYGSSVLRQFSSKAQAGGLFWGG